MNKSPEDRQREHFDSISEKYISSRGGEKPEAYKEVMWGRILSKLSEFLPRESSFTGIEPMCGNADASRRILDYFPGAKMDAFDLSRSMLEGAVGSDESRLSVYESDILKFNKTSEYDLALVIGGLHHIPHDTGRGVGNIRRALKKGGLFLNFEPTHNNFFFKAVRERIYKKNEIFEEESECAFTLKEYNRLLADNGFEILYQCYPGLIGYVLYYNPDAFPLLAVGSAATAKSFASLDMYLSTSAIGRFFSFTTWTISRKK
ncbi:MAG: class I SAM-dependent methyltransferase [Thermodesulfobacteriota bacterium]